MCGKDSAFSHFNPEDLDLDIYVRQASGLGYGRRFTHGPDESVFGDDIFTPKVMDRCIELLRVAVEKDYITSRELAVKLKIGVPIQGTDDVIPFEDSLDIFYEQNEALKMEISSLRNHIFTARSGISMYEHEALKNRYNKLEILVRAKKKIDQIMLSVHDVLDSRIILGEDDWLLEIYEYAPFVFGFFCKKMYTLTREERDMLENRIHTSCKEFKFIFRFFKNKPTIRSISDFLIEKSDRFYHVLHNLPISD